MKPPVTMFVGMWIWTSVAPLQIAIENTTSITDSQLKTASTCSILGEFFILCTAGSTSTGSIQV